VRPLTARQEETVRFMTKDPNAGPAEQSFSAPDLAARLGRYGFTECSTLRAFLHCVCGSQPGPTELAYIRLKLRECLSRHDDGSPWFADLREAEKRACAACEAADA